jgi:hypothetical protein
LLDNAVVLDVEEAERSTQANRDHQEDNECSSDYRIAGQATPSLGAVASVASVFWDLDLNGHGLTRTPVEETACWSDGGTQQKV